MWERSRAAEVKDSAAGATRRASDVASDRKLRKKLSEAVVHARRAQQRAGRVANDKRLRAELREMARDLQAAWARVEKKRTSHRLRNSLLAGGAAAGAAAAIPQTRRWIGERLGGMPLGERSGRRTIEASIEVDVPVSTAYNQWTQFEQFPDFMDGVEQVRQLDDTRLHWVASIGGRRAEWDAKILEQHPDERISWISEDGRETRGTVSFQSLGPARTLVRLAMSYETEGAREAMGSAAGLDSRRIRSDLENFKQLLEAHGSESGAWRGEISGGTRTRAE
jgi:uncharacterized membrane protein